MLWVLGYLVAGVVAIIISGVYGWIILPYVCDYDVYDWYSFLSACLEDDEDYSSSKFEGIMGLVYVVVLWPLAIASIFCEILPAAVSTYEEQFEND